MFGLLRGCYIDKAHKTDWMSHYCGLCVSLSRNFGSISRIFTSSDAVLVSLLYGAQCEQAIEKRHHRCLLRKRRRMPIISPESLGSKYAAIISSLIASSKIIDNVVDGDSWLKYFPKQSLQIGSDLNRRATHLSSEINVDTKEISDQIIKQIAVEQEKGLDFLIYSQPIETATSIACSTTAELTENPFNREPLSVVGRMYGRIIYLLDSYRDYLEDIKNKSFNPLAQTLNGADIKSKAEEIFNAAYAELKSSLRTVQFVHPEPCTTLLGNNLGVVATGILYESISDDDPLENNRKKRSWAHWCDCSGWDCCCDCCDCSECCHCGGDGCCCDCDCSS